jgi:F5/8 type C domain
MPRLAPVLVVVAMLAAACREPAPPQAAKRTAKPVRPPATRDEMERGNLLTMVLGASAISRTAELTLDQSALRAIDGNPDSAWNSPPSDGKQQTLVFALPARTTVDKLGILTPQQNHFRVTEIQFDSSVDGVNFTPVGKFKLGVTDDPQLFPIVPREMVYVRLTTLAIAERFARIQSVLVRGSSQETPKQQPISGCWSMNALPASFTSDRGRVTGTLGGDHPLFFDGGTDGLMYRFAWLSGPAWGFAAINTAPDGKHLSGLRWYEEPMIYSSAESWFGDRTKCEATQQPQDIGEAFMKRAGRYPLLGLRFDSDGALVAGESAAALDWLAGFARRHSSQQLRLLSREYRLPGADQNRKRSQARLDSLKAALQKRGIDTAKFDWVAMGSDTPREKMEDDLMRTMYSVVELQAP